ncbi:hypothetical protein TSACC_21503 [Terrimicrobium sacchariphilum]|jgi:hypothetical protein|uniref:Uncharacterized protein n=1 Tax=Terrimicrobium sacchariphilum TaxID=690879 RepID=A0A146G5R1_TERSA|nr:hypothetical protein [Terrimicrobium sacchariphilum]GAT33095.1 hypothetical protein TSACC_21503 [Terrimicrobium sacchariphilum]
MAISQLSTSVLKNILKLTEQRESLLGEIAKIESQIESLYAGGVVAAKAPRGRGASTKAAKAIGSKSSGRRGALKEAILAALKASGDKGISVKELSEKLGVKAQNVHVWFSSTGRKLGTIQKLSAGRYRLKA